MGHLEVKHLKSPKDKALYIHHLVPFAKKEIKPVVICISCCNHLTY